MKTKEEIESVLETFYLENSNYKSDYKIGIIDALSWVINSLPDEDFPPLVVEKIFTSTKK